MLAVTDSQASKLLFVVKNSDPNASPDGGWALQLRPVDERGGQPGEHREHRDRPARRAQPGRAGARDRRPIMSHQHDNTNDRPALRVYMTGGCDGSETLRAALASHPDVDFVGASEDIKDAAGALAGGHLQVVLHATRASSLPADELASIREHTRAPIVLVASGEASRLLDEALDADVSDVLLLPQLAGQRRVRAPQGRAHGAAERRRPRPAGNDRHRLLAEGRDGQDRHGDEPRRRAREGRGQEDAAARPRPAVRGRRDHARRRAGEDHLRPRRRTGRARLGEARPATRPTIRAVSRSCRRRCARRTPSS